MGYYAAMKKHELLHCSITDDSDTEKHLLHYLLHSREVRLAVTHAEC